MNQPTDDAMPHAHDRTLRRRTFLGASLGAGLLASLSACGASDTADKVAAHNQINIDRSAGTDSSIAPTEGAPALITGNFRSEKMLGQETRWVVARPNNVSGILPVVVVLHALNTNERTAFDTSLQIHQVMQDSVNAGNTPFALACADAGRNYYHPRADGSDAAAMIVDEFLPMLAADPKLSLRTDRIGLYGWSMGGYGALRLGTLLGSPRVAAIAVSSPALWGDSRNFPQRAFDSTDDYDANSLFGAQSSFAKIPLLIEIGSNDQFFLYTRQWMAGLHPPPAFSTAAGGHNNRFWRSVLPDQFAFLSRNL